MTENKERKLREALSLLKARGVRLSPDLIAARDLLEEAIPTHNPRFYKGQPVLVSNDEVCWYKGNFGSFMKGENRAVVGYQPFVVHADGRCRWHHCKPDPDAVSIPNWIEHDGSEGTLDNAPTKGSIVIYITDAGEINLCKKEERYDSTVLGLAGVVRYTIIPLREYLS